MNSSNKLNLKSSDVKKVTEYIDGLWDRLVRSNKLDKGTLIGLPNDYIIPSLNNGGNFSFEEQYYWDSFFIILGLQDKKHKDLMKGIIENLATMYRRFNMIPNASRLYFTSRSQPPLFTTMISLYKERFGCDDAWFNEMMQVAEAEYNNVWMSEKHPHWRKVGQLNRYYDINALHDLAEAESGWDMTPRFNRECLNYHPIDLNSLLFKYEKDIANWYQRMGDDNTASLWNEKASNRALWVNKLLFNPKHNFFFDYNFNSKKQSTVWSLAGFYPLWVGMVDDEQAKKIINNVNKFECDGGLVTTTKPSHLVKISHDTKTQWAYPNGWAPLQWLVIGGLERYGYSDDASRIAKKWLNTNTQWYLKHGTMIEKYNVVKPFKEPEQGVYPNQMGFGWTNGVYVDLAKSYA